MKRIVASIVIKNNYVVNSYGFRKHLPVGKIENIIERLQEWEVDEISILNISHSNYPERDFENLFNPYLLSKIDTPISYGGGIVSRDSAEQIIRSGCERVILSAANLSNRLLEDLSKSVGEQALLVHFPVNSLNLDLDSSEKKNIEFLKLLHEGWGGELFFKFKTADGSLAESKNLIDFINSVPSNFPNFLFGGGISSVLQVRSILEMERVSGVVIGNWFNRDEVVVPKIKREIAGLNIRPFSGGAHVH